MIAPLILFLCPLLYHLTLAQSTSSFPNVKSFGVSDKTDIGKEFELIVTENGYLYEEHKVTTSDGYILKVFRIPGTSSSTTSSSSSTQIKPPVVMWHGISDSSDTFLMNYADKAPGFIMAAAGYDVWFPNSRGNKYSL